MEKVLQFWWLEAQDGVLAGSGAWKEPCAPKSSNKSNGRWKVEEQGCSMHYYVKVLISFKGNKSSWHNQLWGVPQVPSLWQLICTTQYEWSPSVIEQSVIMTATLILK